MIYNSCDIEPNILKLVILGHFLPFYPLKKPQKSKFRKVKKFAGDIIILHMFSKNHNHMIYGSWHMEWDRHNFLSFCTAFCPFTLLWTQKIKILKNETNTWIYYHFTNVYHKWQSYDAWFLRYGVQWTKFFVI